MLQFVGVHDAGSARLVAGRVMPGQSSARFACTRSRQRGKKRVSNRLSPGLSGDDTRIFTVSLTDGAIRASGGNRQAYQT
ncbi:hypothetical protein [Burkholderia cepacia]|nr:hypothetical protein [Burkholderia cepacia]MCA8320410.1 hypothetical protein [Burkholderia cepacia]MDW9241856.1 hypothetical protein [Burkholderia cepacia]